MGKKLYLSFVLLCISVLFLLKPNNIFAQSIKCGYLDEPCCNLAGSPNSCIEAVGLTCSNGKCVAVPGATPPTREQAYGVPETSDATLGCPRDVNGDVTSINTAIGCIPVGNPNAFVAFILRWAVGMGGGIAFILIVVGSFQVMTSSGNPEKIQVGKELITAALAGLIMLIFSIFILKVIGIDILMIPGIS